MGKVIKSTIVTKPEQLTQLKGGPISILFGANLVRVSEQPPKDEKPEETPPPK